MQNNLINIITMNNSRLGTLEFADKFLFGAPFAPPTILNIVQICTATLKN